MSEHDIDRVLRAWLAEPTTVPDDLGEVLARLPSTRQAHRIAPWLPWRSLEMFGAVRFVVSGIVLAVVAGVLFVGLPMSDPTLQRPAAVDASASPQDRPTVLPSRPPLLAGVDLDVEQVEPGVYRVLGDGVRTLRSEPVVDCGRLLTMSTGKIVAGLDGSVWLFWPDRFVRLGDPEDHTWAAGQVADLIDEIAVGPDGTVWHGSHGWVGEGDSTAELYSIDRCPGWWSGDGALRAFDGEEWSIAHQEAYASTDQLELEPGGAVWIAWRHQDDATGKNARVDVAKLEDGSWSDVGPVGTDDDRDVGDLTLNPTGSVYLLTKRHDGGEVLWRLVADGPEPSWAPLERPDKDVRRIVATRDDRLWARLGDGLAVGDGIEWTTFDSSTGMAWLESFTLGPADAWLSGRDGSLWVAPWSDGGNSACAGLVRFDGDTWTRYLDGQCVYSVDMATDGSVWVRAGTWRDLSRPRTAGSVDTYVVDPS